MFENPKRSRQARNFTTNVPKILDLKSSSEQIFFRKLSLGAPEILKAPHSTPLTHVTSNAFFNHNTETNLGNLFLFSSRPYEPTNL